jgi:hypothetical protein
MNPNERTIRKQLIDRALADTIERAVAIAQQRADKIDQATLARAFRGEFVTGNHIGLPLRGTDYRRGAPAWSP